MTCKQYYVHGWTRWHMNKRNTFGMLTKVIRRCVQIKQEYKMNNGLINESLKGN